MREGEDPLAAAEKLLKQRRLPEAVDLLSPWVEAHPDDARALELLAAVRLQLHDWARAGLVQLGHNAAQARPPRRSPQRPAQGAGT